MEFLREKNQTRESPNFHMRPGLTPELCILRTFPINTAKALRTEPLLTSQTHPEWHMHGTDAEQQSKGFEN